jgi:hypothetical protein
MKPLAEPDAQEESVTPPPDPTRTALVLSFSDFANDPRPHRQLRWLSKRFRVVALGTGAPNLPDIEFKRITLTPKKGVWAKLKSATMLYAGLHEAFYWNHDYHQDALRQLEGIRPDLVVANDLSSLPLATRVARGAKVVFDAHEYSPREWEDSLFWRLTYQRNVVGLCRQFLPRADAMLTVCQGIADEFQRTFQVSPRVITNAPPYHDLAPRPTDPARIRLITHGAAIRARRIENMIAMMAHLDERFELDLMLVPNDPAYVQELRELAARQPRVRFVDPVPMTEIVPRTAEYDMGVFLLEPTNFNYAMALPNKFFEFLQARLAIAIGPSPEMARIVTGEGCGVVAPDFRPETLARALNTLTAERIDGFKQQAHRLAARYSAEENERVFMGLVSRLLGEELVRT